MQLISNNNIHRSRNAVVQFKTLLNPYLGLLNPPAKKTLIKTLKYFILVIPFYKT